MRRHAFIPQRGFDNHSRRWSIGPRVNVPEELENDRPEGGNDPVAQLAYLARQGIYDASSNVIAYELLYRHAESARAALIEDDTQATLHVIVQMAIELGLDRLADKLPVHINYPSELLEAAVPPPFPASRVVIEVLEGARSTPKLLAGLAAFRSAGYRIALDDFCPGVSDSALLPMVDTVKLDISCFAHTELAGLVRDLRKLRVTLVAEHVETASEFERCRALGFDAYQGYFLQHPQMFSARPVPSNRLAALRLVAYLQGKEPNINEVANLISKDLSLPYQVLRCINSSYYGFTRKVGSIQQATVILGFERVHQLCALVALRRIEDRPASIFVDAMTRARMCEQLGIQRDRAGDASSLFVTGLFSMLDAITGIEMSELLKDLPLSAPVTEALLTREGPLGLILREVIDYERGAWTVEAYRGLSPARLRGVYFEAIRWAQLTFAMTST
jgi:c-di-GMP phosphodiesterase